MQGRQAKPCSYFLVRYVPNLLRDEGLNIGVLLHCPEERYLGCRFAEDFRWLRRLHPQADLELLGELQADFEKQIESSERDQEGYLHSLRESLSNLIQLDGPRACLVAEPQTGIDDLYRRSIGPHPARTLPPDSRPRIKERLAAALAGARIWEQMEKRIPAERWTQPGDPFTFDYGYRLDDSIRLIHALSLRRDTQLAKTLVYTLDCVRRSEAAKLTAVVESAPESRTQHRAAFATLKILEEGQIALQPLAGVEAFADSIRQTLEI
jgi:hypothetical protein